MSQVMKKQSAHWVDLLIDEIHSWSQENHQDEIHVDDMKTPSGRVHTGSLRGVLLHDVVAKALVSSGMKNVVSTYVFNDLDPMDGLPSYLNSEQYQQYMGFPMCKIPAPDISKSGIDILGLSKEEKERFLSAKNFAEFYAFDFIDAFRKLGSSQDIVWSHQLYESGEMNESIKTALENTDKIKKIYQEIANYQLPENWFPFQVICPQCGKVGTTLVTDWDGEQVTFECQHDKVEWAKGCGYKGKTSPFNGTGKLLWKVDWPAHWANMGINVEGAGKDHTSAGGSRDMANALIEQVFNKIVPFDIPYEWILVRGSKMSSSKGVGTSAREFVELFPAEVGRFLFVNRHYNSVIDFDPSTDSIPDLFDQYDQGARIFWKQEDGDERIGRSFELSQLGEIPLPYFLPRFRDIVTWMQDPKIDLNTKLAEVKGSDLTNFELDILEERKKCALVWLERYAPEKYKLGVIDESVEKIVLKNDQLEFLQSLDQLIDSQDWQPEELQQKIYELAKSTLGAKQGFQAIYLSMLGKTAGPKAAWLLLDIAPELRKKKINEVIKQQT